MAKSRTSKQIREKYNHQPKAAYTANREAGFPRDATATNSDAWANDTNVNTYTSSKQGRLSTNGRTAGGSTWTFTQKDSDGNKIRQSGRRSVATRRQRYYDVRVGLGMSGG